MGGFLDHPEILMPYTFTQHLSIYSNFALELLIPSNLKKKWTWVKDVIIWQHEMMMSLFMVALWMPRKNNTSVSMNITNPNLTL